MKIKIMNKELHKVIADMTIRGTKLVNFKFNNHRRL